MNTQPKFAVGDQVRCVNANFGPFVDFIPTPKLNRIYTVAAIRGIELERLSERWLVTVEDLEGEWSELIFERTDAPKLKPSLQEMITSYTKHRSKIGDSRGTEMIDALLVDRAKLHELLRDPRVQFASCDGCSNNRFCKICDGTNDLEIEKGVERDETDGHRADCPIGLALKDGA